MMVGNGMGTGKKLWRSTNECYKVDRYGLNKVAKIPTTFISRILS